MIIVADIGGSRMRIAVSDAPDSFEEPVIVETPASFDEAVATFADTVRDLAQGRPVTGGAVGVPGLLSPDRQTLLRAPNLPDWAGRNVVDAFSQAVGAPIRFENDVALGALGEARYGAGVGASIVAYLASGTGVNGARVTDGRLDRPTYGFEIGFQLLGTDASAPEWTSLVSGTGFTKRYGTSPREVTDPAVWNEVADYFAYGLYNTILHWSPERVVLGGTFFTSGDVPLERVRATLRAIAHALPELPDIKLAKLGDRSGLYGALALATAS